MATTPDPELMDRDGPQPSVDTNALAVLQRADIDSQIATAREFPRSVAKFMKEAGSLVTIDEEIAEACIYSLPRGKDDSGNKKFITGPSARFAEIIQYSFGNNSAGGRVVSIDKENITAQGVYKDLERNVTTTKEVSRRITDKYGKRYNADMIGVTGNAAISIALRNATLAGIPQALWLPIYEKARQASVGDITTLTAKRANALAWFAKVGVSPEQIFTKLGIEGEDDIGLDQLETLVGIKTALRRGDYTPERAFAPEEKEPSTSAAGLGAAVAAKRAGEGKAVDAATTTDDASGAPVMTLKTALQRLHAATNREELDLVAADFSLIQKATDKQQAQMLYDTKTKALK